MTADEAKKFKISRGDLMQINPTSGMPHAGRVGMVAGVSSWGVALEVDPGGGTIGVSWSNMEFTGGRARWDGLGQPIPTTVEAPPTHHA